MISTNVEYVYFVLNSMMRYCSFESVSIFILSLLSSSAVSACKCISGQYWATRMADLLDFPVDSLKEKEVVSNKEHFYLKWVIFGTF